MKNLFASPSLMSISNQLTTSERVAGIFENVLDEELFDSIKLFDEKPINSIQEAIIEYENSNKSKLKILSITKRLKDYFLKLIEDCDNDIKKITSIKIEVDKMPDFISRKTDSNIRSAYYKKLEMIVVLYCVNISKKEDVLELCQEYGTIISRIENAQELVKVKFGTYIMDEIRLANNSPDIKNIFEEVSSCNNIKIANYVEDILISKMEELGYEPVNDNYQLKEAYLRYRTLSSICYLKLANDMRIILDSNKVFNNAFNQASSSDLEKAIIFYDYENIQIKIIKLLVARENNYLSIKNLYVRLYKKVNHEILNEIMTKWLDLCRRKISNSDLAFVNKFLSSIEDGTLYIYRDGCPTSQLVKAIYDNFFDDFVEKILESDSIDEIDDFASRYEHETIEQTSFERKFELAKTAEQAIDIYISQPPSYKIEEPLKTTFESTINEKCMQEIQNSNDPSEIRQICEMGDLIIDIEVKKYAIERVYSLLLNGFA